MSLLNSIFSWIITKRIHQMELFIKYPSEIQQEVFNKLISKSKNTDWGKKHGYNSIYTLSNFKNNVPIQTYEDLKPWIERQQQGESDVLWPGEIKWFAKSSGTTQDKSKFIPISKDSLEDCHYKGGKDMLAIYYHNKPQSMLFSGKSLVVGGSTQINQFNSDSYYGDLSAIIIKNLPFWVEYRRTPDSSIALMSEWEEKIEKMAKITCTEDVTNIAGVPSWTLILLRKILEITSSNDIIDVWPNLELYIHGGISMKPYEQQYKNLFRKKSIDFLETYNASEGFFGIQDSLHKKEMLLMLDYGIFYEFVHSTEWGKEQPETLSLEEVVLNEPYEIIISTNGGLWRYRIGDTIAFTSIKPYKIVVTGRTKQFINAFGEEFMVHNAEEALNNTCAVIDAIVAEYMVMPVFIESGKGYHQWYIEFDTPPNSINIFIRKLDEEIKKINSDYEAKRYQDMILQPIQIKVLPKGTFYAWMKTRGKLGGQNKVPRLTQDENIIRDFKVFIQNL